MVTEDYVSFGTAKLLKEKGFDWDCKQVYDLVRPQSCADGKMYDNFPDKNPNAYDELVSAPTLQMAMKWLREVHNIALNVCYFLGMWVYSVYRTDVWSSGFISEDFNTYEEACEAGIKYCLEKLK